MRERCPDTRRPGVATRGLIVDARRRFSCSGQLVRCVGERVRDDAVLPGENASVRSADDPVLGPRDVELERRRSLAALFATRWHERTEDVQ